MSQLEMDCKFMQRQLSAPDPKTRSPFQWQMAKQQEWTNQRPIHPGN